MPCGNEMSFPLSPPSLGAQPCIRPGFCRKPKELFCLANPGDSFKAILRSWITLEKCSRSSRVRISDAPTLDSKQSCSPSPLELSPLLALQQHLHNILTCSHPLSLGEKSRTLSGFDTFKPPLEQASRDEVTPQNLHSVHGHFCFPCPYVLLSFTFPWQQEAALPSQAPKLQFPLDYCSVKS